MRTGAIDCGTNSIRLLIADTREEQGRTVLDDVVREMRVVRLGQGVDATGWLAEAALERTFAATDEYARLLAEHGVEQLRFVATSATRDAGNRDVFLAGIRERLGVSPEVITGDEEADLSFLHFPGHEDVAPGRRIADRIGQEVGYDLDAAPLLALGRQVGRRGGEQDPNGSFLRFD